MAVNDSPIIKGPTHECEILYSWATYYIATYMYLVHVLSLWLWAWWQSTRFTGTAFSQMSAIDSISTCQIEFWLFMRDLRLFAGTVRGKVGKRNPVADNIRFNRNQQCNFPFKYVVISDQVISDQVYCTSLRHKGVPIWTKFKTPHAKSFSSPGQ